MKTIALRFAETFAPKEGTIYSHQKLIDDNGYVYYGKLGSSISKKVKEEILNEEKPRILLIHSGSINRYWAYVEEIQTELPPLNDIPSYYHSKTNDIKTWFKILKFEKANKNVLSQCYVISSKKPLTEASKFSMSPYFIIEYIDEEVE